MNNISKSPFELKYLKNSKWKLDENAKYFEKLYFSNDTTNICSKMLIAYKFSSPDYHVHDALSFSFYQCKSHKWNPSLVQNFCFLTYNLTYNKLHQWYVIHNTVNIIRRLKIQCTFSFIYWNCYTLEIIWFLGQYLNLNIPCDSLKSGHCFYDLHMNLDIRKQVWWI